MIETYIAYHFKITPLEPAREILIAELNAVGFESFTETTDGLSAFIPKSNWQPHILHEVYILNSGEFTIVYDREEIEPINWNEKWESNFTPIEIDQKVSIRAPFHKTGHLPYNILIEPKMSFGTGHHETTHLMVQQMLNLDFTNKPVLDMGCGTGVLAILAEFLGASKIDAVDIDKWSFTNTLENIKRNNCKKIHVFHDNAQFLKDQKYGVILANINLNILLQDMDKYLKALLPGGILVLSGFYREDLPQIEAIVLKDNLKKLPYLEKNNWFSASYLNPYYS